MWVQERDGEETGCGDEEAAFEAPLKASRTGVQGNRIKAGGDREPKEACCILRDVEPRAGRARGKTGVACLLKDVIEGTESFRVQGHGISLLGALDLDGSQLVLMASASTVTLKVKS